MARTIIYRGEDKILRISLTKTLSGVTSALDLTTLEGYIAILYYPGSRNILQKFSKNAISGYEAINEVDPEGGVFDVYLDSSDTTEAVVGDIDLEIKTQKDIVGFTGFHSVGHYAFATIVDSRSKREDSL